MRAVYYLGALAFIAGTGSLLFGPQEAQELSYHVALLGIGSMIVSHGAPKE